MTAAVESDGMEWVFAGLVAGKVCVAKESYGSIALVLLYIVVLL